MVNNPAGPSQYLARYGDQSVTCSQYALMKMGVDRSHCYLKIDEYIILCAPFQLGFKRALFLAYLSKQELAFFRRYVNEVVGLSITFSPQTRQDPVKLYMRCNLITVGTMKGRENVGLLAVGFKNIPPDFITILGAFLETIAQLRVYSDNFGTTEIRMSPEIAKNMGYNLYATVTDPVRGTRRIHVVNFSAKGLEHIEVSPGEPRIKGEAVNFQLYFRKYRVNVTGQVERSELLPNNLCRSVSSLSFCPELVEIVSDYLDAQQSARRAEQ
jgi:hypothetical protein